MPEANNYTSADTKRNILQHLMFGVLGLLILMNWTVHRPLDYVVYNVAFENSSKFESNAQQDLQSYFKDASKEDEFYDHKRFDTLADLITFKTLTLLKKISLYDSSLQHRKKISTKYLQQGDSLIFCTRHYLDDIFILLGIESNPYTNTYYRFVLSEGSLKAYKSIIGIGDFPIDNRTQELILATLNSLKSDVVITQTRALDVLFEKVHERSIGLCGGVHAIAVPEFGFCIPGKSLKAIISVVDYGSFISNKHLNIRFNKGRIDHQEQGIFYWSEKQSELGVNTVLGNIMARKNFADIDENFSFSYFVSAPGIAFHLDKANLCYVAVPNPISISVPGYPADKIKLRVADAKVSKTGDGQFEVFFSKTPAAKVYAYVEATNEQGHTSTVHSMELKVKNLPAPISNLEPFKESGISLEELKKLKSIMVQPVDAAFNLEYEVISFQVEGITQDGKYIEPITVYGDEFSNKPELMSVLNAATVGDRFIFSHILTKATNGKEYEALPVSILLK